MPVVLEPVNCSTWDETHIVKHGKSAAGKQCYRWFLFNFRFIKQLHPVAYISRDRPSLSLRSPLSFPQERSPLPRQHTRNRPSLSPKSDRPAILQLPTGTHPQHRTGHDR